MEIFAVKNLKNCFRWLTNKYGYHLARSGAIYYLLNCDGKKIGGGYHRYFFRLSDGSVCGQNGSSVEVVIDANGQINNDGGYDGYYRKEAEAEKDVFKYLGNDYSFMQDRALKYLTYLGKCVNSRGFHRFFLKNGAVYGQIGAREEVIIDVNGVINET